MYDIQQQVQKVFELWVKEYESMLEKDITSEWQLLQMLSTFQVEWGNNS